MPKTNTITFAVSQDLKNGMVAAGNYPLVNDLQAFYTAQNAMWVVIGTGEGGLIRCIGNTSDFTDLFTLDDPDLVRAWSMQELSSWFVNNYVYDNYLQTQQGSNITISFTVEGLPFSGTSTREVDALAIAVIDLLNSPVAISANIPAGRAAEQPAKKTTLKKGKSLLKTITGK